MSNEKVEVLLVEDGKDYASLLRTVLARETRTKFHVDWVKTLADAVRHAHKKHVDVAILDLNLPDCSGVETVSRFCSQVPNVPVMVVSGTDDEPVVFDALQKGAKEYLVKDPATVQLLPRAIRYVIERSRSDRSLLKAAKEWRRTFDSITDMVSIVGPDHRFQRVNKALADFLGYAPKDLIGKCCFELVHGEDKPFYACSCRKAMESGEAVQTEFFEPKWQIYMESSAAPMKDDHGNLTGCVHIIRNIDNRKRIETQLEQSVEKLYRTLDGTVNALGSALELRDPYTAGHERRVARLAMAIAGDLGLTEDRQDGLRVAGLLHDIGKIAVPSDILSKPGKLSAIEYDMIKTHPQVGHDILAPVEFPWPVARMVVEHHEKLDGSGYPGGLSNGGIMPEARILCVADVVEAMSSHRPYRPARGVESALKEIKSQSGVLYDSDVVEACNRQFKKKGFNFEAA